MGNLIDRHPDDFMQTWEGCSHLDCLAECRHGLEDGHCERLKQALDEYYRGLARSPTAGDGK